MRDKVERNQIAAILLLLVVFSPRSFAQKGASAAGPQIAPEVPVASFAGCYDLTVGRWWPWSFGEETKYVTPPSLVRLLPERGTKGFEKDGFIIRTLPTRKGMVSGRGGPSYWQIRTGNRIDLVWTDGFTGVTLTLEKSGDELHGWAHPQFDSPILVPRIAHVTARRVSCEARP